MPPGRPTVMRFRKDSSVTLTRGDRQVSSSPVGPWNGGVASISSYLAGKSPIVVAGEKHTVGVWKPMYLHDGMWMRELVLRSKRLAPLLRM